MGVDRDATLIEQARALHVAENLTFAVADVLADEIEERFDIVNAARVLQWIDDRETAIRRMAGLTKPGGLVVVLDYIHEENRLFPAPPPEFERFYRAFLDWRAGHGWDNRMGDSLPALLAISGLTEITSTIEDELTETSIWPHVLETLGPRMVAEGALTQMELLSATESLRRYCETAIRSQTLVLRAVTGVR